SSATAALSTSGTPAADSGTSTARDPVGPATRSTAASPACIGGFATAHASAARSARTSAASASRRASRAADSSARASMADAGGAAAVVMHRTYVRPLTLATPRSVPVDERGRAAICGHVQRGWGARSSWVAGRRRGGRKRARTRDLDTRTEALVTSAVRAERDGGRWRGTRRRDRRRGGRRDVFEERPPARGKRCGETETDDVGPSASVRRERGHPAAPSPLRLRPGPLRHEREDRGAVAVELGVADAGVNHAAEGGRIRGLGGGDAGQGGVGEHHVGGDALLLGGLGAPGAQPLEEVPL